MSGNTAQDTRVAIVTGAAQGIGKAISLRLAADGLDVVVADLASQIDALNTVVEEIQHLGRKAIAVVADVSKEDDVKAMVEATVSAFGRLDVMVANAGVGGNVASVMDVCRPSMVKQGTGGRIIGASSMCGQRGYAGVGGYCISKAAVRSMTQTAGSPSHLPRSVAATPMDEGQEPGSFVKQASRRRSNVASFLASPGSHFITGQTISVDDGVHFT
ncbi:hypothetical protein K438DRAFT_1818114 [Mycena galopus ATCC 62051]|nr:hypothetical protein K438DRAFT_1818114 [Mycena galopus ATCC 62051]